MRRLSEVGRESLEPFKPRDKSLDKEAYFLDLSDGGFRPISWAGGSRVRSPHRALRPLQGLRSSGKAEEALGAYGALAGRGAFDLAFGNGLRV